MQWASVVNNSNGKIFDQKNDLIPTLSMADALLENGEHKKAVAVYLQLEKADDTTVEVKRDAQLKIGQILEAGIGDGIEQNYAKALNYYVKAANNGSGQALKEIESMQINPVCFERRSVRFDNRVEQLIESCNKVASMYNRMGNVQDYNKWMNKSSALDEVQFLIDEVDFRINSQMDETASIEKLWKEAEQCRISSQFEAEYIIYLFLAELNNAEAEFCIGLMNFHGKNVVKDVEKGLAWLKRSAEHGKFDAQNDLGHYYLDDTGVARDVEEAFKYLQMAVKNKNANGLADAQLGFMYQNADGVAKNDVKALEHYERAAELGNLYAQHALGLIYFKGDCGVVKNVERALKYFDLAAQNKNADGAADAQLGSMYQNADGVAQDDVKALEHLNRAAELGNAYAQRALGLIYLNGDCGVVKNVEVALIYFELAVQNKNADGLADYELGLIYLSGDDVPKDVVKALKHFTRGAAFGVNEAENKLAELLLIKMDLESTACS